MIIFELSEENLDSYCQSKGMVDFLNLQGKLEPLTYTGLFLTNFQTKANLFNEFVVKKYSVLKDSHISRDTEYKTEVRKMDVLINDTEYKTEVRKMDVLINEVINYQHYSKVKF